MRARFRLRRFGGADITDAVAVALLVTSAAIVFLLLLDRL